MKEIEFNHKYCTQIDEETGEIKLPRNGSNTKPISINDMQIPEEPCLNFVQMMNNGFRQGVENLKYSYWTGCIFEDIDYKKFMAVYKNAISPEIVYNDICDWLKQYTSELLYYSEFSRSGKGFHFIFYFNTQKTENIWKMCKSISTWLIKYAFYSCGYQQEIDYKGVWDDCANTIYQACFITKNKGIIYDSCTGDCNRIVNENRYSIEKVYNRMWLNKKEPKESEYNRDDWNIEWSRNNVDGYVGYYEHSFRWRLFSSLSGLCGDNQEKLDEEWLYVASHIEPFNKHSTEDYERFPYKLDWNKKRTGKEYVDKKLLENFGYIINFKFIGENKNEDKKTKKINSIRKEKVYL